MTQFAAAADSYDRFMGRYSSPLAAAFAEHAGVTAGQSVVDVGCGPGALTAELVARGATVAAIDPAPQFTDACHERHPDADVRVGAAEELPWQDDRFDVSLAQLVVAFMNDADAGIGEMARVTRPGGTVAACMWDIAGGGMTMLRHFWTAVKGVDPDAQGERRMAGTSEGDLVERFVAAGLDDVEGGELNASASYTGFEDFWEPFTLAVGPAGAYLAGLDEDRRAAVREACRSELPEGAFTLDARAWVATGRA